MRPSKFRFPERTETATRFPFRIPSAIGSGRGREVPVQGGAPHPPPPTRRGGGKRPPGTRPAPPPPRVPRGEADRGSPTGTLLRRTTGPARGRIPASVPSPIRQGLSGTTPALPCAARG